MDQVGGPIAMHERLDLFHHFVSLRLRSARRFSSRFSIHSYNTGSRNSVNKVEVINPPTTTVASGLCVSAPTPLDRSIGTRPRIATLAVISTGRSRSAVPWITASRTDRPLSRNSLRKQIGSAHVCTPVTNAHLVCRLHLEKQK